MLPLVICLALWAFFYEVASQTIVDLIPLNTLPYRSVTTAGVSRKWMCSLNGIPGPIVCWGNQPFRVPRGDYYDVAIGGKPDSPESEYLCALNSTALTCTGALKVVNTMPDAAFLVVGPLGPCVADRDRTSILCLTGLSSPAKYPTLCTVEKLAVGMKGDQMRLCYYCENKIICLDINPRDPGTGNESLNINMTNPVLAMAFTRGWLYWILKKGFYCEKSQNTPIQLDPAPAEYRALASRADVQLFVLGDKYIYGLNCRDDSLCAQADSWTHNSGTNITDIAVGLDYFFAGALDGHFFWKFGPATKKNQQRIFAPPALSSAPDEYAENLTITISEAASGELRFTTSGNLLLESSSDDQLYLSSVGGGKWSALVNLPVTLDAVEYELRYIDGDFEWTMLPVVYNLIIEKGNLQPLLNFSYNCITPGCPYGSNVSISVKIPGNIHSPGPIEIISADGEPKSLEIGLPKEFLVDQADRLKFTCSYDGDEYWNPVGEYSCLNISTTEGILSIGLLSPTTSPVGELYTFIINMNNNFNISQSHPVRPTGNFSVVENGQVLATSPIPLDGAPSVEMTMMFPEARNYGLVIKYDGNEIWQAVDNMLLGVSVGKGLLKLALNDSDTTPSVGGQTTIKINITNYFNLSFGQPIWPTGNFSIYDDTDPAQILATHPIPADLTTERIVNVVMIFPEAKTYSLVVKYDGDANWEKVNTSSKPLGVTVQRGALSLELLTSDTTTSVGAPFTARISISNNFNLSLGQPVWPTGNFSVYDNDTMQILATQPIPTDLALNRSVNVTMIFPGAKNYSLIVKYDGDENWKDVNTSSALVEVAVEKGTLEIVADVSNTTPSLGTLFFVRVNITTTFNHSLVNLVWPTGGFNITPAGAAKGAPPLATYSDVIPTNQSLSVQMRLNTSGSYSLVVTYSGDENWNAAFFLNVIVPKALLNLTLSLDSIAPAVRVGKLVNLTLTLASPTITLQPKLSYFPSGNISLFRKNSSFVESIGNLINISSDAVTLTYSVNTSGWDEDEYFIYAEYSGDMNWENCTSNNVSLPVVIPVTLPLSISASPNSSLFGQNVTFSAHPDAGNRSYPTGTLTFLSIDFDGREWVTSASNNWSYVVSDLLVGTYSVKARYDGDESWLVSWSSSMNYTVNRGPLEIDLSLSHSHSVVGENVTVEATPIAHGRPLTGTLVFTHTQPNGTTESLPGTRENSNSIPKWTYTTSDLIPGTHLFAAVYQGDSNWLESSSTAQTLIVNNVVCDECHTFINCSRIIIPQPTFVISSTSSQYYYSQQISLEPRLTWPACISSLPPINLTFFWQDMNNSSRTFSVRNLVLAPKTLPVGSYQFSLNVTTKLNVSSPIQLWLVRNISFKVIPTPFSVKINGGNRQINQTMPLLITTALSNPDGAPLSFQWSCSSCPPDLSLPDEDHLNFTASTFEPGKYNFTVNVSAVGTSSIAWVEITVVAEVIPIPVISISTNGIQSINPQDTLRLIASVSYPGTYNSSWSVDGLTLSSKYLASPRTSLSLVVLPGLLEGGNSYTFRINVTVSNKPEPTTASVSISVNPRPTGGSCNVTSAPSTDLEPFQITCSDWTDPSSPLNPLTYALGYQTSPAASTPTPLTPQSSLSVISAYLPIGTLNLSVTICTVPGACEIFFLPNLVIVQPPVSGPNTDCIIANYTNTLLTQLENYGDSSSVLQLVNLFMSIMLNDSLSNMTVIECNNVTSDAKVFRAELWETFLRALHQTTNQESISSDLASQMAQTLVILTESLLSSESPQDNVVYLTVDVLRVIIATISSRQSLDDGVILVLSQLLEIVNCDQLPTVYDLINLLSLKSVDGTVPDEEVIGFFALRLNSTSLRTYYQQETLDFSLGYLNFTFSPRAVNSSYVNQAFLDITVARYDLRRCRNASGQVIQGDTITIELSNLGQEIDVHNLSVPFQFFLPLDSDAFSNGNGGSCGVIDVPKCAWWNTTHSIWETDGCTTMGIVTLPDNSRAVKCACTHLTDFSVLLRQAQAEEDCVTFEINETMYSIFSLLYLFVFSLAFVQLLRTAVALKSKRRSGSSFSESSRSTSHRSTNCLPRVNAVLAEHLWISLVCILRALSCASIASIIHVNLVGRAFIVAFPYAVMFWVFTALAFQWANVIHFSMKRSRVVKEASIDYIFYLGNLIVFAFVFAWFICFAVESQQALMTSIASIVVCVVYLITGVAFIVYGSLIAKQLTQMQNSSTRKSGCLTLSTRIFVASILLSSCFIIESVIWAVNTKYEDERLDTAFFVVDLLALLSVLFVFYSSVQTLERQTEHESVASRSTKARPTSSPGNKERSRGKSDRMRLDSAPDIEPASSLELTTIESQHHVSTPRSPTFSTDARLASPSRASSAIQGES